MLVETIVPTLSSLARQTPTTVNTTASSVTWRLTFSEGVTGVDGADFTLITSGTASGTVGAVTPVSTSVYDIAVTSVAGIGTLRLDLKASGTGITDLAGNALAAGGFTGESYLLGSNYVFDSTGLAPGTTRNVSNTSSDKVAQRFTTDASGSATLTTVIASPAPSTRTPTPVVTVNADNAGAPGSVIATLNNPSSLAANTLNAWTSSTVLSVSTTYWIVFADTSVSGAYNLKETAATSGGTGAWLTSPDYVYRHGANAGTGPQAGAIQLTIGVSSSPAITSPLIAGGTYGSALNYAITATNLPTSFGATGLPTGLSLNPSTGAITGTPTQTGSFNVSLTATNSGGTGTPATLVLTIAKAALTATANSQTRAVGAADPTFTFSYAGFVNGDTVASLTAQPSATTNATSSSPAGSYVITPTGGSASNYTFTYVSGILTITQSVAIVRTNVPITLNGLSQVYNGSPRVVTTTTVPADLRVNITYTGSSIAPTNAGTYIIEATLASAEYSGFAYDNLTVAKATQTISFTSPASASPGTAVALSATASSGLPVTFSVVSGSATISGGNHLTVNGSSAVTVRATQAGNTNYNAVSVDQTIDGPSKLAQTIAFDELGEKTTNETSFTLSATASSGLPVSFAVVSGPATLSGNTVTLGGTPGTVEICALQAGNSTYQAAPEVVRSFTVAGGTNRLVNLSSRNRVGPGTRALITGFVVSGAQPKRVLVRAAGPALTGFGVGSALRNPRLQLFRDGQVVHENDDWRQATNATDIAATATRIGAFPFANDSQDAAILAMLPAGAYTTLVVDDTGDGVGLAEIYDASETASTETQRLVNISTRGESGAGESVLIGGIVVTGNTPKRLLIRGVGPALASFGVTGALTDSMLKLYDSSARMIAQNDNWETPQPMANAQSAATDNDLAAAAINAGAFALTSGSRDSAIIVTLAAGTYTAHVSGAAAQTGVALIEVYELPE